MGVETKYRVAFTKGQSVRVTDGPFAEFIGTVEEINPERNKVKVLVQASSAAETPVEARLPASREALERNRTKLGQPAEDRIVLTLRLPASAAAPAPPVGTALSGPHGINIVEFTKAYNEKTQDKAKVRSSRPRSRSSRIARSFILKTPPAASLLRKAAGDREGLGSCRHREQRPGDARPMREDRRHQDGRSQRQ